MTYVIETREMEPQPVLAVRVTVPMEEIPTAVGEIFGEVYGYAARKGLQSAGMPYARYHTFEPQKVDMECGALLAAPTEGEGRIVAGELPGGTVVTTWHIGPYDGLSAAYDALMSSAAEQGRVPAGGPWEVYHTSPDEVPDPAQWRTEIFLPLA